MSGWSLPLPTNSDSGPADAAATPWRHRDVLVSSDSYPQPVLLPQLEHV